MKHNSNIDILRGYAAILVILGHSFITYPVNIRTIPWCVSLHVWISSFHMPIFFFLAGAVYKFHPYKIMVKKKATRLLIPYFFWGFIYILSKHLGGVFVEHPISIGQGIKGMLLYGAPWFIYALFILFLFYPVIDRLNIKYKIGIMIFLVIAKDYLKIENNLFCINNLICLLPYFILGQLLSPSLYGLKGSEYPSHFKSVAFLIFSAIYLLQIHISKTFSTSIIIFIGTASHIIALSLCIQFIFQLTVFKKLGSFLADYGKLSLPSYLYNDYIIVIMRLFICKILHITSPITILLGLVLSDVLITFFACKYIVPHSKILMLLSGIPIKKRSSAAKAAI